VIEIQAGKNLRVQPQRPDQVLNPPRIESVEQLHRAGAVRQREWRAEELTIAGFQAAPQTGVRVNVLPKLHQ